MIVIWNMAEAVSSAQILKKQQQQQQQRQE